ncbi:hypothetical protein I4U23_017037 [Adineta vaga]|nr:hypothetical protein I4U23_017037 [Adineta vaga]
MILSIVGFIVSIIGVLLIFKSNHAFYFYLQSPRLKGLLVFFGGLILIFLNAGLFGICLELYGLFIIFGGVLPLIYEIIQTLPGVAPIVNILRNNTSDSNHSFQPDYPKRILVVGLTGAGKSTLIYNACRTKLSQKMIHSGAKGNPMECWEYHDAKYIWCDTAGFGEAKHGAWDTGAAIIQLIRFLKKRRSGFHLAIFLARRGRVTEELQKTYSIFDVLLPKETVRVLIYTHDSFDYGTDKWFSTGIADISEESSKINREYLELNGMIFTAALGVDFPLIPTDARINDKKNAEERRIISQEALRNFIDTYCSHQATALYTTKGALRRLFEKALKATLRLFTFNQYTYESETFKWLKNIGIPEEKANEAVQLLETE